MVITLAMEDPGDGDKRGVNGRGIYSGRGSLPMALASCPVLANVDICVLVVVCSCSCFCVTVCACGGRRPSLCWLHVRVIDCD